MPIVLITRKDLPVNDFKEFVTTPRRTRARCNYGSAGAGSATHLGCVVLNYVIGVDITHVPYRGTGPAMQDLQGGRIDYLCEIITTAKPQIDGGSVKAIAIFDKQRSPALPNLPTAADRASPTSRLYLECDLPAERRAGGHREETQRRHARSDENASGAGASGGARRADRRRRRGHAGISRHYVKSEIEKWAVPIKACGLDGD